MKQFNPSALSIVGGGITSPDKCPFLYYLFINEFVPEACLIFADLPLV
jgi:hypothetical protein